MYEEDDDDDLSEDEGPGIHDAHLMDAGDDSTVLCPKCKKEVWAKVTQCPHCKIHYAGEAWEYGQYLRVKPLKISKKMAIIIIIIMIATFIFTVI